MHPSGRCNGAPNPLGVFMYCSIETLKTCRKHLVKCLAAEHVETNARLKKILKETIAEIDRAIEENDSILTTDKVWSMIGKILDMLPRIASIFENFK